LAVITRYFIPAAAASETHASASKLTGLKSLAMASYSGIGILALRMIHSPRLGTGWPFQNPAGRA